MFTSTLYNATIRYRKGTGEPVKVEDMDFRHYSTSLRHDEEAGFELYDPANDRHIFAQWSRAHGCYECETIEFEYGLDQLAEGEGSDEPTPILDSALLTDADLGGCELREVYGGMETVNKARAKFKESV